MKSQDELKQIVAQEAVKHIVDGAYLGVGTGSTVQYFIKELAQVKDRILGAVSTSKLTTEALQLYGIPVVDLNMVDALPVFIDSADEALRFGQLVKGGGGALAQEKIVATAADKFVCIIDESKLVDKLGVFPVSVEVIAAARSLVGRAIVKLGGDPVYRDNFITDNGNLIIDIENLNITQPKILEQQLSQIPGVVESGVFANTLADVLLVATQNGIDVYP